MYDGNDFSLAVHKCCKLNAKSNGKHMQAFSLVSFQVQSIHGMNAVRVNSKLLNIILNMLNGVTDTHMLIGL